MDISHLNKARAAAISERDIETALAGYHPDVVFFDVVHDLHYQGIHAMRSRLSEWLSSLSKITDFEIRALDAGHEGNTGWGATLQHIVAETTQGMKLDMWWRETALYRQENGKWLIVHVHSSVPFDPSTGKAAVELKP